MNRNLFADTDAPSTSESNEPQVLLRALTTPATFPWVQARVAEMEARLQAPLPPDVVVWKLKRLTPWRSGVAARFLAAYVRRPDVGEGLSVTQSFEGRNHVFEFLPPGQRQQHLRRFGMAAAAAGAATLVTAMALFTAVQTRLESQTQLNSLELVLARQQRQAASQAEVGRRDQILVNAGLEGQRPSRMLADLAWVARNRIDGVSIEGALWEPGLTAVEIRGDQEPFQTADRMVRKSTRQVRPGVSLWGVSDLGVVPQDPQQ